MHIIKTNFNGNPNVGMYGFCNNHYCLVGPEVPDEERKQITEVLDVPVHEATIAGTSLLGVFIAGNDQGLLIPDITFESERSHLKRLGIPFQVINTKLTALGNNILCSNKGCLINKDFEEDALQQIKTALNIPTQKQTIANLKVVGAIGVLNDKGCLIHRDISTTEKKTTESLLKVTVSPGTVNIGVPFIRSGILANNHGFVISDASGGPEIVHCDEALGFMGE